MWMVSRTTQHIIYNHCCRWFIVYPLLIFVCYLSGFLLRVCFASNVQFYTVRNFNRNSFLQSQSFFVAFYLWKECIFWRCIEKYISSFCKWTKFTFTIQIINWGGKDLSRQIPTIISINVILFLPQSVCYFIFYTFLLLTE